MDFEAFVELRDRLRAGEPATQAEATQWLTADIEDSYRVEFLNELLKQCPDEQLLQLAREVLNCTVKKHAVGFELLGRTLLRLNPEFHHRISHWLTLNPDHAEVPFIIGMLVDHSGTSDGNNVLLTAEDWVRTHPEHTCVGVVLRALARQNTVHTNDLVSKWISEHRNAKYVGSIRATLVEASRSDEVRDEATAWLKSNPLDPNAGFVLASILETKPSPDVRKMAIDWIKANPGEWEAITVLRTLLSDVSN